MELQRPINPSPQKQLVFVHIDARDTDNPIYVSGVRKHSRFNTIGPPRPANRMIPVGPNGSFAVETVFTEQQCAELFDLMVQTYRYLQPDPPISQHLRYARILMQPAYEEALRLAQGHEPQFPTLRFI